MNHYVYEITNLVNGKKYIGKRSCKCPIEDDKYMGSGKLLKLAIGKYGIENFEKRIVTICRTEEYAYEQEHILISVYDAYNNENYYNLNTGGKGGMTGVRLSEETKKKISEANKNQIPWIKGKTHSDKVRQILSNAHKGKVVMQETRDKLSKCRKGKALSEETKKKISETKKGCKVHSEEWKKKLSNKMVGNQTLGNNYCAKKVICLNNEKIFDCITSAGLYVGVSPQAISRVVRGKGRTSGKINGEPAKWMYYEDYLNMKNKKA